MPALFTELTASGPSPVDLGTEQERVETLVLSGDALAWRDYLRACVVRLEEAAPAEGQADSFATLVAVLRDQYLLARAVVDLDDDDEAASRRLTRLDARSVGR